MRFGPTVEFLRVARWQMVCSTCSSGGLCAALPPTSAQVASAPMLTIGASSSRAAADRQRPTSSLRSALPATSSSNKAWWSVLPRPSSSLLVPLAAPPSAPQQGPWRAWWGYASRTWEPTSPWVPTGSSLDKKPECKDPPLLPSASQGCPLAGGGGRTSSLHWPRRSTSGG